MLWLRMADCCVEAAVQRRPLECDTLSGAQHINTPFSRAPLHCNCSVQSEEWVALQGRQFCWREACWTPWIMGGSVRRRPSSSLTPCSALPSILESEALHRVLDTLCLL